MGFNPSKTGDQYYTVYAVERELSDNSLQKMRFQMFKEKGDLKVLEPTLQSKNLVDKATKELGEAGHLSEADQAVLALAYDLKNELKQPVVVSDDYAVQNLAEHLEMKYRSLANIGIVRKYEWIMYCPACHRKYQPPLKKCTFCGTILKRKPLSKRKTTMKQS